MTTKDTSAVTPIIAKHLETTSATNRFGRINIAYTLLQAADNPADAPSRSHHLASLIDALIIPAPPIQASEPRRLEDEIPHGRWAIEALAPGSLSFAGDLAKPSRTPSARPTAPPRAATSLSERIARPGPTNAAQPASLGFVRPPTATSGAPSAPQEPREETVPSGASGTQTLGKPRPLTSGDQPSWQKPRCASLWPPSKTATAQ